MLVANSMFQLVLLTVLAEKAVPCESVAEQILYLQFLLYLNIHCFHTDKFLKKKKKRNHTSWNINSVGKKVVQDDGVRSTVCEAQFSCFFVYA